MRHDVLFGIPLWLIAGVVLAFCVVVAELGFRLGARARDRYDDAMRSQFGTIQGALLATLGLLLGFTFAMAVSRFDARRDAVVQEANAIGTAYLRSGLLSAEDGLEARSLIRRYVDAWFADFASPDITGSGESARLQQQLWSLATASAEKDPRSVPTGLFIATLNEAIDDRDARIAAFRNHVPPTAFLLLMLMIVFGAGMLGYGGGMGSRRTWMSTSALSLALVAVLVVVMDLDRPKRGLIKMNPQSMIDLRDEIALSEREAREAS